MKKISKFVLPLLAVGMTVLAVYHVVRASQTAAPLPPPIEPAHTAFTHTVGAAGIVEAASENISIGSPLPGIVLTVYVPVEKVGQMVHKGDPLFLVDNRQLLATLKYNEANLLAAKAQLAKLDAQPRPEEVPPSEAKVQVARATVRMQQDLADRARRISSTGAITEEDLSQRTLATAVAQQQLAQSQAEDRLLKAGAGATIRTSPRPRSPKPRRRCFRRAPISIAPSSEPRATARFCRSMSAKENTSARRRDRRS